LFRANPAKGRIDVRKAIHLLVAAVVLFVGSAYADTTVTVVINNAGSGTGQIQSWTLDLTTGTSAPTGSFLPTGASTIPGANGRAIAVTNTQFYYTELSNGFGPTPTIETGLYNGGAGGPDNGSIPNPLPGTGIQDLHFGSGPTGGDLYALAGYPTQGPFVYVFDPGTGLIVSPVVKIATDVGADGFTILPNGNYLINEGDGSELYDQYNPVTGARIAGTTINSNCGGGVDSTGVDTDGTHLFFDCTIPSIGIRETDLNGVLIHDFNVVGAQHLGEGLSLVENFTPPPPPGVPEPASIVMFGTTAALLGLLKLRRNRKVLR
jgi:hypothetical protein